MVEQLDLGLSSAFRPTQEFQLERPHPPNEPFH
jgi:hypothetical protein